MQVGLVAQRENPRAVALATDLVAALDDDVGVVVDEATAAAADSTVDGGLEGVAVAEMRTCDLVVSIGGDGTFLFAARGAGSTPVVGVNLGEVGFLNAVSPANAVDTVTDVVAEARDRGRPRTRQVHRVEASGDGWTVGPALNEVTVLGPQRGHGQGLDVEVRVDGSTFASGHADGVLVATPTGSTAYNLSEDGPLVHPTVDGFVVTLMADDAGRPPLVVDGSSVVEVRVTDAPEGAVVADGRVHESMRPPETIRIERAAQPVHVAGPSLDFFAALGKLE
jgi:NAD+ kinase